MSHVIAYVFLGVVLSFAVQFGEVDDVFSTVYALVPAALVLGSIGWTFVRRVAPQATDERSAAGEYTSRFLIRLASTEAPILLGFVLAFVGSGAAIRYWVGFAIGAVPLALAGPNDRSLDDYQSRLFDAGRSIDLRSALGEKPNA